MWPVKWKILSLIKKPVRINSNKISQLKPHVVKIRKMLTFETVLGIEKYVKLYTGKGKWVFELDEQSEKKHDNK